MLDDFKPEERPKSSKRRTSIVRKFLNQKEREFLRTSKEQLDDSQEIYDAQGKKRKLCAQEGHSSILHLPEEIIVHIFSFMDLSHVLLCCLNKQLASVINETNWLWKSFFISRFCTFVIRGIDNTIVYNRNPLLVRKVFGRGEAKTPSVEWKSECKRKSRIEKNWRKGEYSESVFKGHRDWVRCLQFEYDKMFSGSADKSIKIWDVDTQECLFTLVGHSRCINCLSHDGNLLASACSSIKLWDTTPFVSGRNYITPSTGLCKATLRGHEDCVWCIQLSGTRIVSGSSDRTLRVWDVETEECVQVLNGHTDCVCCLTLLPDTDLVLSGSSDSTVRCYDLRKKEPVSALQTNSDRVWCLQYEDNTLVAGSSDRSVKVWDFRTQKCIKLLTGHLNSVWALQMEGDKLVSGGADSTVRVWDLNKETPESCVSVIKTNVGCVECLQFEGERLVCGSSDSIIKMYNFA